MLGCVGRDYFLRDLRIVYIVSSYGAFIEERNVLALVDEVHNVRGEELLEFAESLLEAIEDIGLERLILIDIEVDHLEEIFGDLGDVLGNSKPLCLALEKALLSLFGDLLVGAVEVIVFDGEFAEHRGEFAVPVFELVDVADVLGLVSEVVVGHHVVGDIRDVRLALLKVGEVERVLSELAWRLRNLLLLLGRLLLLDLQTILLLLLLLLLL